MTTTLQDAAQQLIDFHDGPAEAKRHDVFIRRIESIRTALAQQGQEPVAYMDNDGNISDNNDHGTFNTPLYAAPAPQAQPLRELSDEEIEALWDTELSADVGITALRKIARAVLKKARVE